jgi:hypothetical protein
MSLDLSRLIAQYARPFAQWSAQSPDVLSERVVLSADRLSAWTVAGYTGGGVVMDSPLIDLPPARLLPAACARGPSALTPVSAAFGWASFDPTLSLTCGTPPPKARI